MNSPRELEQVQDLKKRLGKWVSGQGLLLQLCYHFLSGNFVGGLLLASSRLLVRLLIVGLIFGVFWGRQISKEHEKEPFILNLQNSLGQMLGASRAELNAVEKIEGKFRINRVILEGKSSTFFSKLEMNQVKFRRSLMDRFRQDWDPGLVEISKVTMDLRSGASSSEEAEGMAAVLFQDTGGLRLKSIAVNEISLQWGLSDRTKGSILASEMQATRLGPQEWKLSFKGGVLTQSWLKDLKIKELTATLNPSGIRIDKGLFEEGDAFVSLDGMRIQAGVNPEFSGKIRWRNLPLTKILPSSLHEFFGGSVSGEFKVFGSSNSREGIGFEGDLAIEEFNEFHLSEKIALLQALSIVDVANDYDSVSFKKGSMHVKTHSGKLEVSEIRLSDDKLLTLSGNLTAMEKMEEEQELDEFEKRLIQQRIAPSDPEDAEEDAEEGDESYVFEGMLELGLPKEVFKSAPKLAEAYPVNQERERVLMKVPLEGKFKRLTKEQADEIYQKAAR